MDLNESSIDNDNTSLASCKIEEVQLECDKPYEAIYNKNLEERVR